MNQHNALPPPPKPEPDAADAPVSDIPAGAGINRRALLRGGAAASPILLTFASGPVAATGNCVVASSFVSATVYKSRNPGTTSINCVQKTAQTLCNEAVSSPWATRMSMAPHKQDVASYISTPVSCSSGGFTFTNATKCYHVFKNSTSVGANQGNGLQAGGDIAILQRLVALGYGAPTVFTQTYCNRVWLARNSGPMIAALVNDGGTTPWNKARLIAWLDYNANGAPLP